MNTLETIENSLAHITMSGIYLLTLAIIGYMTTKLVYGIYHEAKGNS